MKLRCEEVKLNLPEYIDRKLNEKIASEISSHLESCDSCRAEYLGLKSFLNFTDPLPVAEPPVDMRQEFMDMLEHEMQPKQKKVVMMPLWLQIAAVIAIALITYSGGYYFGSEKSRGEQLQLAAELDQTRQQVLLASLQESTGPQKIEAVYSISKSEQTGDALIDALVNTMNTDKNVNVRLAAINALSGMMNKNPRIKTALINSLAIQDNSLLQISLIQVLTEMGVKEAKPEIESIAKDDKTEENVKAFAKDMMKVI